MYCSGMGIKMITRRRTTIGRLAGLLLITLGALGFAAPDAMAQAKVTVEATQDAQHAGTFEVPIFKSQILRLSWPFIDLAIGNAQIADVLPLTNRSIYVLGKNLGSTNLSIYGEDKSLLAVVDLVVTHDVAGLKQSLFDNLPDEDIAVRAAGGSVVLAGTVSSASRLAQALAIAERFAEGRVTNLLNVKGSQQVMLEVRFAEIKRSVSQHLNFGVDALFDDGTSAFRVATGPFVGTTFFDPIFGLGDPETFVRGAAGITTGNWNILSLLDVLEEKGLVKTLAEPTLIALSGDTASFLAGGEVPSPVSQDDSGSITVEFKQFGVGLSFTPTVLGDGLINLVVNPEVSALDFANGVEVAGIVLPALSTRRATTTVELRDGESFAIAGLLQNDFQDNIRQIPLLGDIPILGALFRSTEFLREETELVIIVTPHLVRPAPAGSLATPADNFVPPTDADLFLFGRLEAPESGTSAAAEILGAGGAGGIEGNYGHIIE